MNKIIFKVASTKDIPVATLLKEVDNLSCRIFIDFENDLISVEDVDVSLIDSIIALIKKYYTILNIGVNNTSQQEATKSEDALSSVDLEEIHFKSESVKRCLNNLHRTISRVLNSGKASVKEITDILISYRMEISMRYSSPPNIEFSVGDIVDVNYGSHLPGEIMGGHIHAVVCNILNNRLAYVVPITKSNNVTSSYLPMKIPSDAIYTNNNFKEGNILLDKGRYLRICRFHEVLGRTTPEFFQKVLSRLASTFDFTDSACDSINMAVPLPITNDTASKEKAGQKISERETALLEVIGFAYDKLDPSKEVEEQVDTFLTDIGMDPSNEVLRDSFIVACNISRISYINITRELNVSFSNLVEEDYENILKDTFKTWIKKYPTLKQKYPNISFMAILSTFAKRFK